MSLLTTGWCCDWKKILTHLNMIGELLVVVWGTCSQINYWLGMLTPGLDTTYRCLAHIIHLAAKHIVQAFSQDSPFMESDFPVGTPVELDEDSETFYASGDTLGKLWALINQVCKYLLHAWAGPWHSTTSKADSVQIWLLPQATAFFFRCCAEEGLPHLELIKYVWMCWSLMYDLLEQAFLLKEVSSQIYCALHFSWIFRELPNLFSLLTTAHKSPSCRRSTMPTSGTQLPNGPTWDCSIKYSRYGNVPWS